MIKPMSFWIYLKTNLHGNLNSSPWKKRTHLSCTANNMIADDLAPCLARASAAMILSLFFPNTVRRHYNTINFLKNPHNRHPISRPLGQIVGCLLWKQALIYRYVIFKPLQRGIKYLVNLDRVITATDCIPISAQEGLKIHLPCSLLHQIQEHTACWQQFLFHKLYLQ